MLQTDPHATQYCVQLCGVQVYSNDNLSLDNGPTQKHSIFPRSNNNLQIILILISSVEQDLVLVAHFQSVSRLQLTDIDKNVKPWLDSSTAFYNPDIAVAVG